MGQMKIYVRQHDRSEVGMTQPVIDALRARDMLAENWRDADSIIVAGDRREAVRDTLDYFEAGKIIHHLGSGDHCVGDVCHYDGTYRKIITDLCIESQGRPLLLHDGAHKRGAYVLVGPPQIEMEGIDTSERPESEPYDLLCMNYLPWAIEAVEVPNRNPIFMMRAGNDGQGNALSFGAPPIFPELEPMPRAEFLAYVRHAEHIYGNSSAMCYEAPIWHDDNHIHFIGLRNKGRPIVRWNMQEQGRPSENVLRALA